jgi:hypothetical protein
LNSDETVGRIPENQKGAPNVCQILSYLNEILIFRCYHIHWHLGRILEKIDRSLSDALIGVRSRSDRVVGKRYYSER